MVIILLSSKIFVRSACVTVPGNIKYYANVSYCPIEGFELNHVKCSTPNSNVDSGVFQHEAVLGHQLDVPPINSMLTPSTWRRRQILQVQDAVLQG